MSDAHLLIRNYYQAFNERRFNDAAEMFTDDAVLEHLPAAQPLHGPAGYLESARAAVAAFPDLSLQIIHVEQRGDTICEVDVLCTGTLEGEWKMGTLEPFKPTRRRHSYQIREMLEIRGGKFTYSSVSWNLQDIVSQFGKGGA